MAAAFQHGLVQIVQSFSEFIHFFHVLHVMDRLSLPVTIEVHIQRMGDAPLLPVPLAYHNAQDGMFLHTRGDGLQPLHQCISRPVDVR